MKNTLRHLSSFIAPIVMTIVIPALIIQYERRRFTRPVITSSSVWLILGLITVVGGFLLLVQTIRTFILIGKGTIMPWDPTRKLVTAGLYNRVRNPMILSLIIVQLGEAILFASYGVALLAVFNFVLNTIYFIYSEEPGMVKRFGEEYLEYKKNVPRWIPRLKPWQPASEK